MILPRASLKRAPRTRTRKSTTSADKDIVHPPSRNASLSRRKSRPPPLQIIPELSENEFDDIARSPATARPMPSTPRPPTRITLSAYTFSIDDALLMFGSDVPLSPALSASSSTSDGASSEDVPATPLSSEDEDGYDYMFCTPCLRPQRISIRPLRITKTRSLICQEDEDIHSYCEQEEENAICHPVTEFHEQPTEATETAEDFYSREFEDFISLPAMPSPVAPARRDSLVIVPEPLPPAVEVAESKSRGRSRHSKPLPLPPPVTPPISSFPSVSTLPLVQTTAHKSVVRRKRNISRLPSYPPPSPHVVCRPLPRIAIPLDIDDCVFPEESVDISSRESTLVEEVRGVEEDVSIYSRPSFSYTISTGVRPLPPAIPETPLSGMYGEVILPRSSTDSNAPRASVDTTLSSTSSDSSNSFISPLSSPSSPFEERLCSRWSTSTLASLVEPSRSTHFLSPLRSVFGSRPCRVPPPKKIPSQPPQKKRGPTSKHVPRQDSWSSTSSSETNSSACESRDGSPSGPKRKPIPVAMFLRAT